MKKILLLSVIILIPSILGLEGNFLVVGASGNSSNESVYGSFHQVYGINIGMGINYTFAVTNDTVTLTIIYPVNGSSIYRQRPINLDITYSSVLSTAGDIYFYNASDDNILCSNLSVPSGTEVKCGISLYYGDTMHWYVNATNANAEGTTGLLTFFVKALEETGYYAILLLLPVIFGFMFLIGTLAMTKEHDVLKFIALPLAFISVIASLHFGTIIVNDKNPSLTELIDQMSTTTWLIGIIIFVMIAYMMLYAFYKMTVKIAKQREDERIGY